MNLKSGHKRAGMLLALSSMLAITACGGSTAVDQAAQTSGDGKEAVKVENPGNQPSYYSDKPETIRLFTDTAASWPYKENWPIWNWIKENTNITVKAQIPSGNYNDTLALNIASGDVQDVLYVRNSDKYGADGVFLDLAKHLDKMPNFKKFLDDNPQIKMSATTTKGEIYSTIIDGAGVTNQMIWFYRDDIFKKHNLQPPKTWDELYKVSTTLKELYPSSNPLIFRHGLANMANFAVTFDSSNEFFPDPQTGKFRYGPTESRFKDMLGYLNKFNKEGLIPPDWLSMDVKVWNQAMVTGKSFMTVQYIGQMEILNNQLTDGGHLSFMAPPAGPGGKAYIPNRTNESDGFAIYSQTKNLDASLKFIDFLYSKQGSDVLSWGKENETYTVVDGKRKFLPQYKQFTSLRVENGMMTFGSYGKFDTSALISMIPEKERSAYEEAPKYTFPIQIVRPKFQGDALERYSLLHPQITKFYEESTAKFIMGDRPLAEWDKYVEQITKLGVPELLELHQKTWDLQKGTK
jgi:putative aldouronate transport system substrate-binding protein